MIRLAVHGRNLLALFCLIAWGRAAWWVAQPPAPPVWPTLPVLRHPNTDLVLTGEVLSIVRHSDVDIRFEFGVERVADSTEHPGGGQRVHPFKIWLIWPMTRLRQKQRPVEPGDVWRLSVHVREFKPKDPLEQAQLWRWMQQQDLRGMAQVTSAHGRVWPQRLQHRSARLQALRQAVRHRIEQRIADPRRAGLVAALCMGDQSAILHDDWDVFRNTGVAHLVSISGMHVSLLAIWCSTLMHMAWRRLRWRGQPWALHWPAPLVCQTMALAMATAYAGFAGWGLPAQRTVWMMMILHVLQRRGLYAPVPALWALLIAATLWFDPGAAAQPGFWLSHWAVGVLYITPHPLPPHRAGDGLLQSVLTQWRISWALIPLGVMYFQGVSWAGAWVNLWAIPWVSWVLTPLCLLGMAFEPLWGWAGEAAGLFLWGLDMASRTPGAWGEVGHPPWPWAWVACVGAVGAIMPGHWSWRLFCASWTLPGLAWRH